MHRKILAHLALSLITSGIATGVANAGDYRDRIYADSFGNLVVLSTGGYKRIVVGAGELASELRSYQRDGIAGPRDHEEQSAEAIDCRAAPVFVKGRSYMYGLSDGEMPRLGNRCSD